MKLVSLEGSRVVSLAMIQVTKGQPYVPEVIESIVSRYEFLKFPSTFEELASDTKIFSIGRWRNTQIDELALYGDGLIVSSKSDTELLDKLVEDIYETASEKYGLNRLSSPKETRQFESALVVHLDKDVTKRLSFLSGLTNDLNGFVSQYGLGDFDFVPSGIHLEADPVRYPTRRPRAFTLARRVSTPYEDGYWYSAAPLKTQDHLAVLENLETALG